MGFKKIYIKQRIFDNDVPHRLTGPLKETVSRLEACIEQYEAEGWEELEIIERFHYDSFILELWGRRLETDEEFKARSKKEQLVTKKPKSRSKK